jgi:beta-galactosidase/beta-glucuronidase
MGPDREISVKVYSSRLKEVQTSAVVDENLDCSLGVDVQVEGDAKEWEISLVDEDGRIVRKEKATGRVDWEVKDAKLWWPVGEGSPTRYSVKVDLLGTVRIYMLITIRFFLLSCQVDQMLILRTAQ